MVRSYIIGIMPRQRRSPRDRTRTSHTFRPDRSVLERLSWLFPLLVAGITFIAFFPALRNGFVVWDDDKNFLNNPHYRGLGLTQLHWMWTTAALGHYVPLSWMTLGLDFEIWGMQPLGYHLTNILLHCANAVLVYYVCMRLIRYARLRKGDEWSLVVGSTFAALLFAVHPLRVESVVWVTERRDVLSMLFFLGSLLSYLRAARARTARRGAYWLSVVLFACALLSKATAMVLPAVLIVLEIYPLRKLGNALPSKDVTPKRIYLDLVPFVLLSGAGMILSTFALHRPAQLPHTGKIAVSAYSLCFYLLKTFVPIDLSPLYQMPLQVNPLASQYVASYLGVVALMLAALAAQRRFPAVPAAIFAFIAATLPMLGVVQNGPQITADRYTYFAAPALSILVGATMTLEGLAPRVLRIASTLAVIVLGYLTWQQSKVWHDTGSLWAQALLVDDKSSIAHSAWASHVSKQGRIAEALEHSQLAVALSPGDPEAHNALGVALARQGKVDEAIPHFQRALAIKPWLDEAENNWGVAVAQQNDLAGAIEHYRRAAALNPDNPEVHVNWGNALVRMSEPDEAIGHYQETLRIRPQDADAEHNWGVALARQNEYEEAIGHFRRALMTNPMHGDTREYLERATQLLQEQSAKTAPAKP
ncbi:MAG: tetratricopeptide repeat protein [Gemmatimonadota bacterium]